MTRTPSLTADTMAHYGVPAHLRSGLERYLNDGIRPTHFLCAVLSNDLLGAIARWDDASIADLRGVMSFLIMKAPLPAWGGTAEVDAWIEEHRVLAEARVGQARDRAGSTVGQRAEARRASRVIKPHQVFSPPAWHRPEFVAEFPEATLDENPCDASARAWPSTAKFHCTRPAGHGDIHVAHGCGDVVCAIWDQHGSYVSGRDLGDETGRALVEFAEART